MAVSRNDMYVLSQDVGFQSRVRSSLVAASVSITTENFTTSFHRERETYAVAVLNNPDLYKVLFATTVSTDTAVINGATGTGTLALTAQNVVTAQLNATDTSIDNAISAQFNSFFRRPAS